MSQQFLGPTFRFYSIARFAGETRVYVWEHGADGEILTCDLYGHKQAREVALWLEQRHPNLPRVDYRQAFCPERLAS